MPYAGQAPGPLWVRAVYTGAGALVAAILMVSAPLWNRQITDGTLTFVEAAGAGIGLLGIVLILYGFRWHRTGFDDAALVKTAQERMDAFVAEHRREGGPLPPRTKTK